MPTEIYSGEAKALFAKIGATRVVLGVQELKPIIGAPDGRQRIRMRNTAVAKLFVRDAIGIRCFILADCGTHWTPVWEQARNARPI